MGEYKPLMVGLLLILIISPILSSIGQTFGVKNDIPPIIQSTINFNSKVLGVEILGFRIIPQIFIDYTNNGLIGLSFIPIYILIPFLIVIITGMTYAIIKAFPTT